MRYIAVLLMIAAHLTGCDRSPPASAESPDESTTADDEAPTGDTTEAVETAEKTGTCEQAFTDLEALVKGLEEQLGPSDTAIPDREDFIAKCQSLPAEVQECMVFEYGVAHEEECQERVSNLEPDARKRAQELMGK